MERGGEGGRSDNLDLNTRRLQVLQFLFIMFHDIFGDGHIGKESYILIRGHIKDSRWEGVVVSAVLKMMT